MLPRLFLNRQPQIRLPPQPPKVLALQGLTIAQVGVQWHNYGSPQSQIPGLKRYSHLSLLSSWDHQTKLIFLFLFVEMKSRHVAHAGLEFLDSSDLSTSASQSARIIGVSHHKIGQIYRFPPSIELKMLPKCCTGPRDTVNTNNKKNLTVSFHSVAQRA
ncbi:Protein GVQW1 [Plecturocebus cupreus]